MIPKIVHDCYLSNPTQFSQSFLPLLIYFYIIVAKGCGTESTEKKQGYSVKKLAESFSC